VCRQRRLDETQVGGLGADRSRLSTLKRHSKNSATKADSNCHRSIRSGHDDAPDTAA
jgi:hypothetical protein